MIDEAAEKRVEIRRLRGSILRRLKVVYGESPDLLMEESIRLGLGRGHSARMMTEALSYLADASVGYIEKVVDRRDRLDQDALILYRLTAKGLQLLEGTAGDPGVEL